MASSQKEVWIVYASVLMWSYDSASLKAYHKRFAQTALGEECWHITQTGRTRTRTVLRTVPSYGVLVGTTLVLVEPYE